MDAAYNIKLPIYRGIMLQVWFHILLGTLCEFLKLPLRYLRIVTRPHCIHFEVLSACMIRAYGSLLSIYTRRTGVFVCSALMR